MLKRLWPKLLLALLLLFAADWIVASLMKHGVDRYYGLDSDARILCIGHSHLMLAVDKERLERELGVKVAKYCREGVNVSDRQVMVNHYLSNGHADSLRLVLYGVDLCTFTGEGLSKNSYKLMYPFLDNDYVDSYVREQAADDDYWLHRLFRTSRFNDEGLKNSAIRGWFSNWDNFKTNVVDTAKYRTWLADGRERSIQMNPELIGQFTATVDTLTRRGVRVVLVNTPTLDLLNHHEPEAYAGIMDWFRNFADSRDLVEFIDYNPAYESRYEIFNDRLHVNREGQRVMTGEFVELFKKNPQWLY